MAASANGKKKRIVIIGGGPAALATAFELTSDGLADRHDVTILQPGWRLGGKCASGRGPHGRIEEHGLHVWFGCYDNAFALMRRCYDELDRDPNAYAFTSVGNAFEGLTKATLWQHDGTDWSPHELEFPRTPARPADSVGALGMALRMAGRRLDASQKARPDLAPGIVPWAPETKVEDTGIAGGVEVAVRLLEHHLNEVAAGLEAPVEGFAGIGDLDDLARFVDVSVYLAEELRILDPFLAAPEERFNRDTIHLLLAVIRGILQEGLLIRGFDEINKYDLAEWLKIHDMPLDMATPTSWPTLVRAVYDGCFAFDRGDPAKPTIAAGRAVQGMIRCFFHYRGAVIARMRGGMGDTVIAPFYEVLKNRGVHIEFFNAVAEVRPDPSGRAVEAIDVVQQVELTGEYKPLRDYPYGDDRRALPSWSAVAPWKIIRGADRLRKQGERLEHEIDPFGGKRRTLHAGADFDVVVLAVPPDVQKEICRPLRTSARYAAMLDASATVATQSVQLWISESAEALGEERYVNSFASCYVEPLDTYSAMNQLLAAEEWPPDDGVQHVAYFCGVLPDAQVDKEVRASRAAPATARRGRSTAPVRAVRTPQSLATGIVRTELARFVRDDLRVLWEGRRPPEGLPTAPQHPSTNPRRSREYVRANWAPTERYDLTPPGSLVHRLWPNESGFANLVLAGDWTRNSLEVGSVEAAMTSGMLASNAICGSPAIDRIVGINGPPGFPNKPLGDGPPGSVEAIPHEVLEAIARWGGPPARIAIAISERSLHLAMGLARIVGRELLEPRSR
ncbi:MAG TPA: FAD-dependent oxidoreductase [Solirubrobacteraceae bacterium]